MTGKATSDNTLGAAFLGLLASCALFGIAMVQTHLYYYNYPKDWMFQKVAVGGLMTLACFQTAFTIHAMYFYLIVNFGNINGLASVVWSFKLQVIFNILMVLFVQCLYAVRVWKLGKHFSRFSPAVVAFIVASGWGAKRQDFLSPYFFAKLQVPSPVVAIGILAIVEAFKLTSLTNLESMKKVLYVAFASATGVDFVIAGAMCYYLNRSRSSFITVGTKNKILTIMRYVVITGGLTSACSLCAIITFATMPYNMIFLGIDFILPNLYFTSYISMLNARKATNARETSSVDVSKVVHIRSGTHVHSDNNMNPDGIPLSEAKFTSSFSNKYDPEQDVPTKHIGIAVHRTEGREYDRSEGQ